MDVLSLNKSLNSELENLFSKTSDMANRILNMIKEMNKNNNKKHIIAKKMVHEILIEQLLLTDDRTPAGILTESSEVIRYKSMSYDKVYDVVYGVQPEFLLFTVALVEENRTNPLMKAFSIQITADDITEFCNDSRSGLIKFSEIINTVNLEVAKLQEGVKQNSSSTSSTSSELPDDVFPPWPAWCIEMFQSKPQAKMNEGLVEVDAPKRSKCRKF